MRYLAIPLITLFLVTCSAASVARSAPQLQAAANAPPPVNFLLTKFVADFHTHHPSDRIHFHDVRVGGGFNSEMRHPAEVE